MSKQVVAVPELQVGMTVRDNDQRQNGRERVVLSISGPKVTLRHRHLPSKAHWTKVSTKRIHLDGKVRASGWSVVQ